MKINFSGTGLISTPLFVMACFAFLLSGIFLNMSLTVLLLIVALLLAALFLGISLLSFSALLPFFYILRDMKTVPIENMFLFIIGFLSSFIFLFQLSASRGKEINPMPVLGAGAAFSIFYALFSAMKYETFSSLFIISPFGILLIVLIIIFFRIQYYIWKGK